MANRFKLTIEYDGTDFAGWQRQAEGILTVQGVLEQAIKQLSGEEVALHVAGRTDAGVHALGQVAHVDLQRTDITADTIRDAVNFHVRPHRVAILDAAMTDEHFHARFAAKSRAYLYRIVNRRAPPVIDAAYSWHVQRPLNIEAMTKAAQCLIGKHDFSTFRAQFCQAQSPVKTLDQLDIVQEGHWVTVKARARSFLYHQVRNMVGTLCLVGGGQWAHEDFIGAFEACDRKKGGPTAPAQGLFFLGPEY